MSPEMGYEARSSCWLTRSAAISHRSSQWLAGMGRPRPWAAGMRDGRLERILHVEDEPDWLKFMRDALADYHVDSAQTFKAALDLIRGNVPYDLALVDLNLE